MSHPLPPRPRLTLRLAFAGNRTLPAEPATGSLQSTLRTVLESVAACLAGIPASAERKPGRVAGFYAGDPPLIRLVSGLAEGGDDLAAQVVAALSRSEPPLAQWEIAGVLAYPRDDYRASRKTSFHERFDELVGQCRYIVELDGRYVPPPAPTTDGSTPPDPGKRSRAAAYRGQTAVLLRQADLLVALADTSAASGAGGTQEAVRAALDLRIPVIFIDAATAGVRVIGPGDEVDDLSEGLCSVAAASVRDSIRRWVTTQVADPDVSRGTSGTLEEHSRHGADLLAEFFDGPAMPPSPRWWLSLSPLRAWLWQRFERRFKSGTNTRDRELTAYGPFRDRARALTYYYAAQYRGAFLLNYVLAVVAVSLAALSLVILGGGHRPILDALVRLAPSLDAVRGVLPSRDAVIVVLGVLKLVFLVMIFANTHYANHGRWNQRAVDYRYLVERLRAMNYLPLTLSVHPPSPAAPAHSARAVRQSAVDWLFEAIVRHVSPADLPDPGAQTTAACANAEPATRTANPSAALDGLEHWLHTQHQYHVGNAATMAAMSTFLEGAGRKLNKLVIGAVLLDLLVLGSMTLHLLPHGLHWLHAWTPWLILLATLLPAAVAAINGIRFQAECRRLAQRSDVMRRTIEGHRERVGAERPIVTGSHAARSAMVLRVAEAIARDMANEAADWSALYDNVIVET